MLAKEKRKEMRALPERGLARFQFLFHVAIVTPVVHYCMGGLEIDADSRVVKKVGQNMVAIDGLYAAGEIAGGVHGNNRLGGNSLLDCVVFGRVAGRHAAKW